MTSLRFPAIVSLVFITACSTRDGMPFIGPHADAGNHDSSILSDSSVLSDASVPNDGSVVACTDALDIVFVLDVSTSMSDVLGEIRSGLGDIWNTANTLSANAQFGMVVFVDDAVAVNGCAPIASLAELQAQFDHWRDFCASNESPVSGVSNLDCEENSLDAIMLATQACSWRSPATRVLIHVTDDTFVERPARLSNLVDVESTYAEVATALYGGEIRFAAFANLADATCGSYSGAPGFHTTFEGSLSLPMRTGGRAWDLDDVRDGRLNMGSAISELLTEEYCTIFLF